MQAVPKPIISVLLVDDDEEDILLFREALNEIDPKIKLTATTQSKQIVALLKDCSPDLIFLDINLPKANGFDCLKEIKDSNAHCRIPIVMYSSSSYVKDINTAYGLGANLFLEKLSNLEELKEALCNILQMAWHYPDLITYAFYRDGKYSSYNRLN